MDRRQFIERAMGTLMVVAGRKMFPNRSFENGPSSTETAFELSPEMDKAAGEQLLIEMAKSPTPLRKNAAFALVPGTKNGEVVGEWSTGPSDKRDFSSFTTLVEKLSDSGAWKNAHGLNLYRVGEMYFNGSEQGINDEIKENIKNKNLLSSTSWVKYLPNLEMTYFSNIHEMYALAYANMKLEDAKVTGNVATPYGVISYTIRKWDSPWDIYKKAFETASDVVGACKEYGGAATDLANNIKLTGEGNPLHVASVLLNRLIGGRTFLKGLSGEQFTNEETRLKEFVDTQQEILDAESKLMEEVFDLHSKASQDELNDVMNRVGEGGYKDVESLVSDVKSAYSQMSVDISFKPSKEMTK